MNNNITVDGTIGVSAGATFGCNFKSKQIGRTIRYNMKYSKDPRYVGIRSLIKTGDLYGADFVTEKSPKSWMFLIPKPIRKIQWLFMLLQQM